MKSNDIPTSRRDLLFVGASLATAACAATSASVAPERTDATSATDAKGINTAKASDGTSICFKDWGTGQPIVFSHGWPLNADAWDEQLFYFAANGYRTIAHDRRGHGRSGQPWDGNDMDTYADDLAAVFDKLDLRDAVLVGHSAGGGEVARYVTRHGTRRVAKIVLVSAVPPIMIKTPNNPGGLAKSVFDDLRRSVRTNRSQFYKDASAPFFGTNRPGSAVPQGLRDQFWLQSMQCGLRAAHECLTALSETDFTEDLQRIDVPTLILHGEDDQYVPVSEHAPLSAKLVKRSVLKIYPGAPHGLPMTLADQFNADVMSFIRG